MRESSTRIVYNETARPANGSNSSNAAARALSAVGGSRFTTLPKSVGMARFRSAIGVVAGTKKAGQEGGSSGQDKRREH